MKKNILFAIIATIGAIIDRLTKFLVTSNFTLKETLPLWPGVFHFTYVTNTGAAFSVFTDGVAWLRWLSFAVSLGLIAFAWFGPKLSKIEQLGYGLILAGACGNGIDRFLFGYVIDFIDFRLINFPVFNLADVCINLGIVFLLIATFRPSVPSKKIKK